MVIFVLVTITAMKANAILVSPGTAMTLMRVPTILAMPLPVSVSIPIILLLVTMEALVPQMTTAITENVQVLRQVATMAMSVPMTDATTTLEAVCTPTTLLLAAMMMLVQYGIVVIREHVFPVNQKNAMTIISVPMILVTLELAYTPTTAFLATMVTPAQWMMFVTKVLALLVLPKTVTMTTSVPMIVVTFILEIACTPTILLLVVMATLVLMMFALQECAYLVQAQTVTMVTCVPMILAI